MAPPTSVCGHRTAAVDHSTCHPRACPEGPFRRGTAPLESGQEPVSGMDCRDKPGNDSLIRLDKALGSCESATRRTEEHTSELQSLMSNSYDVLCLKKKT